MRYKIMNRLHLCINKICKNQSKKRDKKIVNKLLANQILIICHMIICCYPQFKLYMYMYIINIVKIFHIKYCLNHMCIKFCQN